MRGLSSYQSAFKNAAEIGNRNIYYSLYLSFIKTFIRWNYNSYLYGYFNNTCFGYLSVNVICMTAKPIVKAWHRN